MATANNYEFKAVVVGGGGVGKSALTVQFVQSHFLEEYDPTIEDSYRKQVQIDQDIVILDVLDTAGQEEYSAMREQWLRYGEGIMLVYSLTSKISFDELSPLMEQIQRVRDVDDLKEVPLVLFGNKTDLENERQVTSDEGAALAKKIGGSFFEGSAKARRNVDEAFFQLVRNIRAIRDRNGKGTTTTKISKPRRACNIL